MKKLVERKKLIEFYDMLNDIYNQCSDPKLKLTIDEAIYYYNVNILESAKEELNKLKHEIYLKMINAKTKEENKKYYELYQSMKD